MAATIEQDVRITTLGNLTLITGTFTEGGLEIDYSSYLSNVMAAGANLTSLTKTPVTTDGTATIGDTAITVDGVNAHEVISKGMTIYDVNSAKIGVVSSVAGGGGVGVTINLEAGSLVNLGNNKPICVWGAATGLHDFSGSNDVDIDVSPDVSINETRQVLHISVGRGGEDLTDDATDRAGKWWALGQR
jgi:hypothetical protein